MNLWFFFRSMPAYIWAFHAIGIKILFVFIQMLLFGLGVVIKNFFSVPNLSPPFIGAAFQLRLPSAWFRLDAHHVSYCIVKRLHGSNGLEAVNYLLSIGICFSPCLPAEFTQLFLQASTHLRDMEI